MKVYNICPECGKKGIHIISTRLYHYAVCKYCKHSTTVKHWNNITKKWEDLCSKK